MDVIEKEKCGREDQGEEDGFRKVVWSLRGIGVESDP